METEHTEETLDSEVTSAKKRGGARVGAGRPKGSSNKISSSALLDAIKNKCGKPYEEIFAESYFNAMGNPELRLAYDKIIVNKVIKDEVEVSTISLDDPNKPFTGFTIVPIQVKKNDE